MIELPGVTLVCVDTREPGFALQAIARCTAHLQFARVLLFTDVTRLASTPPEGVEVVPAHIESAEAYSHFMMRDLAQHVGTSHCLVVQWDGFVVDAAQWRDEFLQWDYIGAPWHDRPAARSVGNGGFSLRSGRLLLALQAAEFEPGHPEDVRICEDHRDRLERGYGIRFAPPELASRFAYERMVPRGPTFGFHGLFNMHRVLPASELLAFLRALPDSHARGLDAHDLARELIARHELEGARELLGKRIRLGMSDRRTLRLRMQLAFAQWRLGDAR